MIIRFRNRIGTNITDHCAAACAAANHLSVPVRVTACSTSAPDYFQTVFSRHTKGGYGPLYKAPSGDPGTPSPRPEFCHTREAARMRCSLAHSPCRPPASRLWASTASETRRILTANRIDMWLRCFTWLHLHFGCRCAAQQHLNLASLEPPHASAPPSATGPQPWP